MISLACVCLTDRDMRFANVLIFIRLVSYGYILCLKCCGDMYVNQVLRSTQDYLLLPIFSDYQLLTEYARCVVWHLVRPRYL